MARRELTPGEEMRAVHHLIYEVTSAGAMCGWTRHFEQVGPAEVKNACLESALVHLRLLIEFVHGRGEPARWHDDTDLSPTHFVSDWHRQADFKDDLALADRHLVHLSLERAEEDPPQGWTLWDLTDRVLSEVQRFADEAELQRNKYAHSLHEAVSLARMRMNWTSDTESPGPSS